MIRIMDCTLLLLCIVEIICLNNSLLREGITFIGGALLLEIATLTTDEKRISVKQIRISDDFGLFCFCVISYKID